MAKKKRNEKKESKLLYVPFIIVAVIVALILVLPNVHPSTPSNSSSSPPQPFFQFAKVSNEDYAPQNQVEVYFISWIGCTVGATDSWGLYLALSHYGKLNVTPNYSDLEAVPISQGQLTVGKVPGLIFDSFTPNSTVQFHAIYLLGRIFPSNSSASLPNGTIIKYSGDSLLNLELNELQKLAPPWFTT